MCIFLYKKVSRVYTIVSKWQKRYPWHNLNDVPEVYKSMRYCFWQIVSVFFSSEVESVLQARPLEIVIDSSVLPTSLAPRPGQLSSNSTWSECIWWQNLAWKKERETGWRKEEKMSFYLHHPIGNIFFLY